MLKLLLRIRVISVLNALAALDRWEVLKKGLFSAAGIGILIAIYLGFFRVLNYLEHVQLIGPLLSWKLTAMAFLTTFSMITISGLIASMTTLYYSHDLKFLFSSPIGPRTVFTDKSIETAFYSSWTLVLAIFPFVLALGRIKGAGPGFYLAYLALLIPMILTAAAFGIMFSMLLMYAFPTSRTRDVIWVLGSLSLALVYVMIRFVRPEKLLRPDQLEAVAQYLNYLQAPTAGYLPSWWVTKAIMSYLGGNRSEFLAYALLLFASAAAVYAIMIWISGRIYMKGFSGAQEGRKFSGGGQSCLERRLVQKGFPARLLLTMYWKDRKLFLRDARYWSQIILITALIAVYLFSIRQLPLDTPDIKSIVSFLNIGVAGFVLAALGLRFTFPAVSLEGKSYWVIRSAPIPAASFMKEKFFISGLPTMILGVILVVWSNRLLHADRFVSVLSTATIIVCSLTLSVMGVGLGAVFPRFKLENIHQVESSAGGFIYMACCMGYLGAVIALEAWPVQMHFAERFGRQDAWDWGMVSWCAGGMLLLNMAAITVPWKMGVAALEKYEE
ncbi:MAG: hypothetical protein ABIG11_04115 [bacterium]